MWRIALLMVVSLTVTLPVHAKPNKVHKQEKQISKQAVRQGTFSPAERNLIRSHLLGNKGKENLPSGLQKKISRGKSLPAGWQEKVVPGHNLDYQLYRQGVSLPDILLQRLPPAPVGSEVIRVHDKIIRLYPATRTILDVFDLVPRQ